MPIYYVNIDVRFKRPLDLTLRSGRVKRKYVKGYLQEVGATFDDTPALEQAVEQLVLEDEMASNVTIHYDRIGIIAEGHLHKEVFEDADIRDSLIADPREAGVWYTTGRAFYWD